MSSKPIIAVYGTNGFLGKPTIAALTSSSFVDKIQLPLRVLTRDPSKYTESKYIRYYKADATDVDSFEDAVTGIDVFVNLGPAHHLDTPLDALVKYAKGIKLYIPSQFGTELDKSDTLLDGFLKVKADHSAKARAAGLKTVDVISSLFFAEGAFLTENLGVVELDKSTKSVTIRGDPTVKADISYLPDIGKAVASIATFGDYSKLPDKIRISSDRVSQEEIVKQYEVKHQVTLKRNYVSYEDTLADSKARWAKGFDFKDFFFYLQFLFASGTDKGLSFSKNENELVNPKESLWTWTKFTSI
ncbi:hypothetical protein CANARDRAFT_7655 [[Candida] arabinofermentans NRRL YB-2248]|uniref:NmrA-like domain-containing protein n=1 Tax=[Candida] arabinofermentans NRRL YB-2248 TaxID=983967 RepID=A0A1E4T1E7_9ASCO|nr:hypothetical protein CANARDRAFT_7655 [[Candida] arabinofermentans NRRL YB-2248]